MKRLGIVLLMTFAFFEINAKCDCTGNEVITVCQNGVTKRVNCSALTDHNVFCGPCHQKPNCTPGAACNDGNDCTRWDKYDANCNCVGKLADADGDGVCDAVDRCPDGDDLLDRNKNGMPDECENRPPPMCSDCPADSQGKVTVCWIPKDRSKMKSVKGECEWLTSFFNADGTLKGDNKCGPCQCSYLGEEDRDGDGICDSKDDCPNDPQNNCNVDPGSNDDCDTECQPQGSSEYEWIDKISMNQLENETGDDGGYADFKHLVLELGQGDSLSLWLFPGFLEDPRNLSMCGYIDWNNDCDFDDPGEVVFNNQTDGENGADIAVPKDATAGDLTVRFIVHNGRQKSPCQTCIDGEVEDYTLRIFKREQIAKPVPGKETKTKGKALNIFPNPVFENEPFVIKLGEQIIDLSELKIYSMSGQLMKTETFSQGESEYDARGLEAGVYIFELNHALGIERQKVLITK